MPEPRRSNRDRIYGPNRYLAWPTAHESLDVERFAGQRYAPSTQGEQAMEPGALRPQLRLCVFKSVSVMRYVAPSIPYTDAPSVLNAQTRSGDGDF